MNILSSHLNFERLVDLVEGRLSTAEQKAALVHLSGCVRCAAEKAWLERTIGLMRTDTGEDAPPAVIARARRLFQPRLAPTPRGQRRIPAFLRFDSLQQPLGLGVRGGEPAARQLLLKAEDYDLDLRINPAGAAWQVSGQLLGPDTTGQVELHGAGRPLQAELNELGEFSLPPANPGVYNLLLRLEKLEIEFPRLEIRA